MWDNVEGFVHMRTAVWHATALTAVPDYGTITPTGGWGNDSSSAGFLFAPIDLYKEVIEWERIQDRQAEQNPAVASRGVETTEEWWGG